MDSQKEKQPKSKNRDSLNQYLQFSTLGIQVGVFVWLGAELGSWLDDKYPSERRWFTLACVLTAVTISMIYTIKRLNKINN